MKTVTVNTDSIDLDTIPDFDPSMRGFFVGSIADDAKIHASFVNSDGRTFHVVYKVDVTTRSGLTNTEVYGLMISGAEPYPYWLPGHVLNHGGWSRVQTAAVVCGDLADTSTVE